MVKEDKQRIKTLQRLSHPEAREIDCAPNAAVWINPTSCTHVAKRVNTLSFGCQTFDSKTYPVKLLPHCTNLGILNPLTKKQNHLPLHSSGIYLDTYSNKRKQIYFTNQTPGFIGNSDRNVVSFHHPLIHLASSWLANSHCSSFSPHVIC